MVKRHIKMAETGRAEVKGRQQMSVGNNECLTSAMPSAKRTITLRDTPDDTARVSTDSVSTAKSEESETGDVWAWLFTVSVVIFRRYGRTFGCYISSVR